jgi:hypothetical protein
VDLDAEFGSTLLAIRMQGPMHPSVRPQLDQEVDARESEVSNASKKTRNLRQGSFVRLRFIRKKIGEGDARNVDFASDLALAIFGFAHVAH